MKYLIDLDGTLLDGNKANKDSVKFMGELQSRGTEFLIMTNSIASPRIIRERLDEVGISVDEGSILNPITAVNIYLKEKNIGRAFIVGSKSEVEQVSVKHDKENPQAILLLDFEKENLSYDGLQNIFSLIQRQIPVISASGSTFYLRDGFQYLDTGSFVKLFESAGNIKIEILGKPSLEYFKAGMALLNEVSKNIMVIGDDWRTDINGAHGAGLTSVLIRSGKYKMGDEKKCSPQKTINRLMELFE